MRAHWTSAALFSAVLAAACGGAQTTENAPENEPAETTAAVNPSEAPPAEPVSPSVDTAPAPASRPAPSARPSSPSRPASSSSAGKDAPSRVSPAEPEPASPTPAPAPPARAAEYRTLRVPANTPLTLELLTPLSSETTTVESPVRARLKQAISVDGYTILPVGTVVTGTVTEVAQSGRVKGRSRVAFTFNSATVAGAREKLSTNPIVFEGEASTGQDATKIGVGAGVGAVIGGILGGGSGAAKGAAIGGAAGTGAVLATKGKEVTVAEGADIAATLSDPFEMRVRVE